MPIFLPERNGLLRNSSVRRCQFHWIRKAYEASRALTSPRRL